MDTLPHLVSVTDRALTYLYVNAAYEAWFGVKGEATVGKTMIELLGVKAVDSLRPYIDRVLTGEVVTGEVEAAFPSAGTKSINVTFLPQLGDGGGVKSFTAIMVDVSAGRSVATHQRELLVRLQNAYEHSPVGLIEVDDNLKIIAANAAFAAMLEYTPEEMTGMSMRELTHPDDESTSSQIRATVVARGSIEQLEKRYLTKSGKTVWASVAAKRIPGSKPGELRLFASVQDITALKEAQAEALIASGLLRQTVDAIPLFISLLDKDLKYQFSNAYYDKFFGTKAERMRSGDLKALFSAEDADALASARRAALLGASTQLQIVANSHASSAPSDLEVRYIPNRDPDGHVSGLVAVAEDITERLRIQRKIEAQNVQLALTSKMVALGEMASGVAHEINNPLAILIGKAQLTLRTLQSEAPPDPAKLVANLTLIESMGVRIAKIVKGLRTFSRDATVDPQEATYVRDVIADALALCQERFRHHGVGLRSPYAGEARLMCCPTQIAQILLNLLGNAFDAVVGTTDPWVEVDVQLEANMVLVAVTDSGTGIPEATVRKLMQPFFTTKQVGRGTGLGLSISRGIAEKHGGQLAYDASAPNTRFVLRLPLLMTVAVSGG